MLSAASLKLAFLGSPSAGTPHPVGTPPVDLGSRSGTASEAGCSSNLLEPV